MKARFQEWANGRTSIDLKAETPEEEILLRRIHTLKRGGDFPALCTITAVDEEGNRGEFDGAASFDFEMAQPREEK